MPNFTLLQNDQTILDMARNLTFAEMHELAVKAPPVIADAMNEMLDAQEAHIKDMYKQVLTDQEECYKFGDWRGYNVCSKALWKLDNDLLGCRKGETRECPSDAFFGIRPLEDDTSLERDIAKVDSEIDGAIQDLW